MFLSFCLLLLFPNTNDCCSGVLSGAGEPASAAPSGSCGKYRVLGALLHLMFHFDGSSNDVHKHCGLRNARLQVGGGCTVSTPNKRLWVGQPAI